MRTAARTDELLDKLEISQLEQNWGTWRDAADWENLRTCYTPTATMITSWQDDTAAAFIERSIASRNKQQKDRGPQHVICGTTAQVQGDMATAETRIILVLRAVVHEVLVDITVYGRFFDSLVRWNGEWRIQKREPVYDKDSMQPVDPSATLKLDAAKLAALPPGFRHLAYAQSLGGADIVMTIPEPYSEAEKAMYARGRKWLQGDKYE